MPEVSYVGSEALIGRAMGALEDAVAQSGEALATAAQRLAPVDTGTLRASIHVDSVERSGMSVTATVSTGGEASEYAVYVELGTRRMAAQPYMTPALAQHEPVHVQMCANALKGAFGA